MHSTASAARNGTLTVFAANGFVFASWMSRVPDIKAYLGITPGQLGLLLLAISLGSLLGLPLAGRIAHRLGAGRSTRLGAAIAVPCLVLVAALVSANVPFLWLTPGLFVFGFGTGIWDLSQNLEGTIVEQGLGRAIMPWFHAAFSGGTVVGAVLGVPAVAVQVPLLTHLGTAAAITMIAVFAGTARFVPAFREPGVAPPSPGPDARVRSAWTEPRTLLVGLMVLAAAFTEGTANDWLAVAFGDGYHLDHALGVVALGVFLSFMTAGRVLGTRLLDRFGRVRVLRVLFSSGLIGCALVVFGGPVLAFVGVAIWGVGSSLGFPVGMSAAADDPDRAAARLSVVSTIGYGAFLGGPPLIGLLGDHVGVLMALLAVGAVSITGIFVAGVASPLRGSGPA